MVVIWANYLYFMLKFLKKIKFISVFWIFFYLFIFGILLQHSFGYLDPDLGWHLKVGQEISQTNIVPRDNHYNYTFIGKWVDHEWLSNLTIYNIYESWGYLGLSMAFSGLIVFILILLNIFTQKLVPRAPGFLLAFLQVFGVLAALPHFGVRIQELNILFLLLLLYIIYEYDKKGKIVWLMLLPPLFYLWVNLHGGFLLGLAILLSFMGVRLFERIVLSRWKPFYLNASHKLRYSQIAMFSVFTVLSFGVTLFTPYFLKLYSFLGGYGNTYYLSHIQEWLSQFYFPFNYWQLGYLALAGTLITLYLVNVFHYRREKIDLWNFFLIILFFVLSFKSRRHFPLFFVVSFVFLIENIVYLFNLKKTSGSFFGFGHKLYILVCFIVVMFSQVFNINTTQQPFQHYCQEYPCEAVQFLQNNHQYDSLNLLNEYNWGGFMIWVNEERQLFIDGRLPQTEFAGHTFLEEYLEFFKKDTDYQAQLDKYNVGLILLTAEDKDLEAKKWEKIIFRITEEELKSHNYLRAYLSQTDNWQLIYDDDVAKIYLKKN